MKMNSCTVRGKFGHRAFDCWSGRGEPGKYGLKAEIQTVARTIGTRRARAKMTGSTLQHHFRRRAGVLGQVHLLGRNYASDAVVQGIW